MYFFLKLILFKYFKSFSIDDNVFYHGQKLKMCLESLEYAKFITTSNLMNCLWHNYKKKYNYKFGSKVKLFINIYVNKKPI